MREPPTAFWPLVRADVPRRAVARLGGAGLGKARREAWKYISN
jgi:hypothetical protein